MIAGSPFGLAVLALKEVMIGVTWVDRNWYTDFLERQLTRNVSGGKVEAIKVEGGGGSGGRGGSTK